MQDGRLHGVAGPSGLAAAESAADAFALRALRGLRRIVVHTRSYNIGPRWR